MKVGWNSYTADEIWGFEWREHVSKISTHETNIYILEILLNVLNRLDRTVCLRYVDKSTEIREGLLKKLFYYVV